MDLNAVSLDFINRLNTLEPYGEGNLEPVFAIQDVILMKTIQTKNGHLVCKFAGKGGGYLDAVCFRAVGTPLGDAFLRSQTQQHYHLAGVLRVDNWNGNHKVQLIISDAALA